MDLAPSGDELPEEPHPRAESANNARAIDELNGGVVTARILIQAGANL
jgi:hypothetical protein